MIIENLKGENGAVLIDAATYASQENTLLCAIQMITDCQFTQLTSTNWIGGTATSITYPAGLVIYGRFTDVEVSSGSCLGYFP